MKKLFLLLLLAFSAFGYSFQSSFLKPDEAFKPRAQLKENGHIAVDVVLGKGIYVYEDSIKAKVLDPDTVEVAKVEVDQKVEEHDGDKVYMKDVPIDIALSSKQKGTVPVRVQVEYQGCSDKGLCYEPQTKTYDFKVDFSGTDTPPKQVKEAAAAAAPEAAAQGASKASETDIIVDTLKGGSLWAILALFFGFGLALSLTPCIFPMIPILSSIIVSQGENITARRGFMLSLVYVLAMAVAYSVAGVLAGIFGENLQVALQNPWIIGAFALIFVALAFSMFGFYEIGLPASLQTKLSRASDEAGQKGGFAGVAVMGFLSALIVGPCVAPGLAAALIYIGQTGNAALGGAALFVMSIGMGVPLMLIGIGAGRFMPKPGGWMNTVTKVFGAVMMGIAIWMIARVVPEAVTMLLWAIFFIVSAVYMGALERLPEGTRGWNAFFKAVGIVFLLYGSILLVGALSGGKSMTEPLAGLRGGAAAAAVPAQTLDFRVIHSRAQLDAVLNASKGKKVMVDFSAQWCSACKEYEEITFSDPRVIAALKDFVLVQADVTANSPEEKALSKAYGIFGPPGILFFDENGRWLQSKTLIGYKPPEAFLAHLKSL